MTNVMRILIVDDETLARAYLAEQLEGRLMLYHTYVGEGDSSAKWGTTDLTYSIANVFDVTGADLRQAVIEALGVWTGVTPLKFTADYSTTTPGYDPGY